MREIEHRRLRYAIAAAELGSFRQTALKFNVRQSAISRRIRDLEGQLGARLFERTAGGVVPTDVGRAFLDRARSSLLQLDEAADIAALSGQGVLRIGLDACCEASFFTAVLGHFVSRHRGIRPMIVQGSGHDHLARIRAQRLDVALMAGWLDLPDCTVIKLREERLVAVLPQSNILATKNTIQWGDLAGLSFLSGRGEIGSVIHECLAPRLARTGYVFPVEQLDVGREILLSFVRLGKGFSLTTESMPDRRFPSVVYCPISGPDSDLPLNAVTSNSADTRALRGFLQIVRLCGGCSRGRASRMTQPTSCAGAPEDWRE